MRLRSRTRLRALMAKHKLSQAELARRIKKSPGTVNHLLTGRMTTVEDATAAEIAEALDVKIDDLFAAVVSSRKSDSVQRGRVSAA